MLQSWTKSVIKNFALFLPTERVSRRFGTAMVLPIPSPQPSQSCLVKVKEIIHPDLNIGFFGGWGEYL